MIMQTSPESKFTPGPWEMKEVPTQCGRAFRIGRGAMLEPGPKGCCIIYDDYGAGANEHKANAHLIASAPDLYEALKAILSNHETVGAGASIFQCTTAEVTAARAALAKAEGR